MNAPGNPPSTRTKTRAWVWLPLLAGLFVTCAIAIAATAREAPAEVGAIAFIPIAIESTDPDDLRLRCAGCGRVQSIRRIEATATEPESFEFTVRMYGGDIHTSNSASAGPWLAGDRIILIGAIAPAR